MDNLRSTSGQAEPIVQYSTTADRRDPFLTSLNMYFQFFLEIYTEKEYSSTPTRWSQNDV